MLRRALFLGLFAGWEPRANDTLPTDWERFSTPMNKYIDGLNRNVNDVAELRKALHAWRRMEKDLGWDKIR